MSSARLILDTLQAAAVLLFLYGGTFIYLFIERLVAARVQHREGPGRHGALDVFQVWKDFLKTRPRAAESRAVPLRFRLAMAAWKTLPPFFILILLAGLIPQSLAGAELPALLLLALLAVALEAVFLHGASGDRERIEWRRRLLMRVMGASFLALSFLVASLEVGIPGLSAISGLQARFPFHLILSGPGLFLCGLAALGAIFLFVNENPVQNEEELSLGRSMHYAIFFVRRMWIFCLMSFWVYVFLGGTETIAAKVLFPIKLAAGLLLFSLLQGSFPRIRSSDAGELAVRWLLRLCLIGFILEAVWVGVGR